MYRNSDIKFYIIALHKKNHGCFRGFFYAGCLLPVQCVYLLLFALLKKR